jgi:hypothetical protein
MGVRLTQKCLLCVLYVCVLSLCETRGAACSCDTAYVLAVLALFCLNSPRLSLYDMHSNAVQHRKLRSSKDTTTVA